MDQNIELKTPAKGVAKDIVTGRGKFDEIVGTDAFVDKTLFIQEVVTSKDAAILLTCPRRFGKSSNLDMLKTFLEIKVDDEGKEVEDKSQTQNYKLFQNLKIAEDTNFMQKHCGQHPVIFVDFLSVKGSSYEEILNGVKTALHKTFKQHEYMVNVYDDTLKKENLKRLEKKKTESYLKKFEKYVDEEECKKLDNEDVKTGLQFLSELLHKHFGKRAYVLVDEYDAPVHSAINKGLDEETVKKVNWLIDEILCAVMKSNDTYLERGVMTGISGMVRASAGSDLNNVFHYKFLDNHVYASYYGFTEAEIDTILKNLGLEHMKEGIENWYDGYRMRTREKKPHIFCPWSILYYLKKSELGNYWEASGSIQNIQAIFRNQSIRETMETLIRGEELEFTMDTKLDLDKVKHLMSILNCNEPLQYVSMNLFFSYLFELGYLSNVEGKPGYYRLPNEEIRSEMASRVLDFYISQKILPEDAIEESIKALEETCCADNQVERLKEALNNLFKDVPLAPVSDPSKSGFQPNEDFYHTIINSLAIRLVADRLLSRSVSADKATPPKHKKIGFGTEVPFRVCSKRGRADIVLIKDNVGVIIELKHSGQAVEALNQIKEKEYVNILKDYTHLPKIKAIGINVSKDQKVNIECSLIESPFYTQTDPATKVENMASVSVIDNQQHSR